MLRLQLLLRARLRPVQHALAARTAPTARQIHRTRQAIKQSRSLLRLLRPTLTDRDFRGADRTLRAVGASMGSARDRTVILDTLAALSAERPHMRPAVLSIERYWRSHLRGLLPERPPRAGLDAALARLNALDQRIQRWPQPRGAGSAARDALGRCYRKGRRAWKRATRSGDEEHWHTCRKHAKYLYYQLGSASALAVPLQGLRKLARNLGSVLGSAHDLVVLRESLHRSGVASSPSGAAVLYCIAERETRLLRRAQKLATRLYAQRALEFMRAARAGAVFEPATLPGASVGVQRA